MKAIPKMELMAPAGSWESLRAAINAGADAVYFGVGHLNMRARAAKPFTEADISEIAAICRQHHVKSYLALNTIMYDEDLQCIHRLLLKAKEAQITAIIATDMAAILAAKNLNLEVHASVQANISNIEAVRFFALYADVIVLARELTLNQIRAITQKIKEELITGPSGNLVRIELFVHGALCVAVSGKCYMSLALTGHSANRGDCFQMCRRTYHVTDTETRDELEIDNQYIMSPKDLCTIGYMDKLIESGVSVFKIEGRGRSPDYVHHTVKAYREAIDSVLEESYSPDKIAQWTNRLESVFNRGFWHGGYYLGHPLGEWNDAYGSQSKYLKMHLGKVLNYYPKSGIAYVDLTNDFVKLGDTVIITGPTTGYVETEISSLLADDQPAAEAVKGQRITFPVPELVRRNDKVYAIRERQ